MVRISLVSTHKLSYLSEHAGEFHPHWAIENDVQETVHERITAENPDNAETKRFSNALTVDGMT